MPEFQVTIETVYTDTVTVYADDETQAEERARQVEIAGGDIVSRADVIDIERVSEADIPELVRQSTYLPEFRVMREKALALILAHRTSDRVHAACQAQKDVDGWELWQAALSVIDDRQPGVDLDAWENR
jgi:hypothetical protein